MKDSILKNTILQIIFCDNPERRKKLNEMLRNGGFIWDKDIQREINNNDWNRFATRVIRANKTVSPFPSIEALKVLSEAHYTIPVIKFDDIVYPEQVISGWEKQSTIEVSIKVNGKEVDPNTISEETWNNIRNR